MPLPDEVLQSDTLAGAVDLHEIEELTKRYQEHKESVLDQLDPSISVIVRNAMNIARPTFGFEVADIVSQHRQQQPQRERTFVDEVMAYLRNVAQQPSNRARATSAVGRTRRRRTITRHIDLLDKIKRFLPADTHDATAVGSSSSSTLAASSGSRRNRAGTRKTAPKAKQRRKPDIVDDDDDSLASDETDRESVSSEIMSQDLDALSADQHLQYLFDLSVRQEQLDRREFGDGAALSRSIDPQQKQQMQKRQRQSAEQLVQTAEKEAESPEKDKTEKKKKNKSTTRRLAKTADETPSTPSRVQRQQKRVPSINLEEVLDVFIDGKAPPAVPPPAEPDEDGKEEKGDDDVDTVLAAMTGDDALIPRAKKKRKRTTKPRSSSKRKKASVSQDTNSVKEAESSSSENRMGNSSSRSDKAKPPLVYPNGMSEAEYQMAVLMGETMPILDNSPSDDSIDSE